MTAQSGYPSRFWISGKGPALWGWVPDGDRQILLDNAEPYLSDVQLRRAVDDSGTTLREALTTRGSFWNLASRRDGRLVGGAVLLERPGEGAEVHASVAEHLVDEQTRRGVGPLGSAGFVHRGDALFELALEEPRS